MRTADLNAELLREISVIISDKELTKKTLEFVRSLKETCVHTGMADDTISKKEVKKILCEGLNEVRLIKEGKLKGIPAEEVFK